MSNKMITVCNKQISEDTVVKALKAYCEFSDFDEEKAPVFSYISSRLIIKMNDNIRKYFAQFVKQAKDGDFWSFAEDGFIGTRKLGNIYEVVFAFYSGNETVKSLFPKKFPVLKYNCSAIT